jgi:hypothetical protein
VEVAGSDGHYGVWGTEDDGPEEPHRCGQGLGACLEGFSEEGRGKKRDQGKDGCDHIGRSEHAWALV